MNYIKVCFIYDPEPNERYLEILSKMTPGGKGIWKNIVGVSSIEEADYCVIVDTTNKTVPKHKAIYLQAHPDEFNYPYRSEMKEAIHVVSMNREPAFGEWWLDADYDTLKALQPMEKGKELCCIISNSRNVSGHKDRIAFLERLCSQYPDMIHVYGRIKSTADEPSIAECFKGELGTNTPQTYWWGKDKILSQYKYSLELDALSSPNYFSERFYDALLMWCKPIYWGCPNIHDHFPKDSCESIDIYREGDEDKVISIVGSGNYNLTAIECARNLLLDKYQIWAKTYEVIKCLRLKGL